MWLVWPEICHECKNTYRISKTFKNSKTYNGHGFGWTLGVGDGQGGLVCCGSWGCKGSDTTERLNWTELKIYNINLHRVISWNDNIIRYFKYKGKWDTLIHKVTTNHRRSRKWAKSLIMIQKGSKQKEKYHKIYIHRSNYRRYLFITCVLCLDKYLC